MPDPPDICRLVLATTNPGKLRELKSLLSDLSVPLVGIGEIGRAVLAAPEDGATLADNARAKAAHYAQLLDEWVLSDDTGLHVDALDGAPGVQSARYAGPDATPLQNREKLLLAVHDVATADRTARFVCCLAVAAPDGRIVLEAAGACAGRLRSEPAGTGGFGYDALFEVEGVGRTLAELDDDETARFGHRGQAVRQLIAAWHCRQESPEVRRM